MSGVVRVSRGSSLNSVPVGSVKVGSVGFNSVVVGNSDVSVTNVGSLVSVGCATDGAELESMSVTTVSTNVEMLDVTSVEMDIDGVSIEVPEPMVPASEVSPKLGVVECVKLSVISIGVLRVIVESGSSVGVRGVPVVGSTKVSEIVGTSEMVGLGEIPDEFGGSVLGSSRDD